MPISTDVQQTALSAAVELFVIDATNTNLGNTKIYVQPSSSDTITFSGNQYVWMPVEIEGVSNSSSGPQPTPTLRMSNVNMEYLTTLVSFDDLLGAQVTYIRTFEKYLNNQNGSERFSEVKFDIIQKTVQNKTTIEFSLGTLLDRDSLKIPGRRATSDILPGMALIN